MDEEQVANLASLLCCEVDVARDALRQAGGNAELAVDFVFASAAGSSSDPPPHRLARWVDVPTIEIDLDDAGKAECGGSAPSRSTPACVASSGLSSGAAGGPATADPNVELRVGSPPSSGSLAAPPPASSSRPATCAEDQAAPALTSGSATASSSSSRVWSSLAARSARRRGLVLQELGLAALGLSSSSSGPVGSSGSSCALGAAAAPPDGDAGRLPKRKRSEDDAAEGPPSLRSAASSSSVVAGTTAPEGATKRGRGRKGDGAEETRQKAARRELPPGPLPEVLETKRLGTWTPFPIEEALRRGLAGAFEWRGAVLDPPALSLKDAGSDTARPAVGDALSRLVSCRGPCRVAFPGAGAPMSARTLPTTAKAAGAGLTVAREEFEVLLRDLLEQVRFSPSSLQCDWKAATSSKTSKLPPCMLAVPDLNKTLPSRPVRILDNAGDAPAQQPPDFKTSQLRSEQLRSLGWMLRREQQEVADFAVEWRYNCCEAVQHVPGYQVPVGPYAQPGALVTLTSPKAATSQSVTLLDLLDHETEPEMMFGRIGMCSGPEPVGGANRVFVQVMFEEPAGSQRYTLAAQVRSASLCFVSTGTVAVGAYVKIADAVAAPSRGWPDWAVTHSSVGAVLRMSPESLAKVRFPTGCTHIDAEIPASELEVVDALPDRCFRMGAHVFTTSAAVFVRCKFIESGEIFRRKPEEDRFGGIVAFVSEKFWLVYVSAQNEQWGPAWWLVRRTPTKDDETFVCVRYLLGDLERRDGVFPLPLTGWSDETGTGDPPPVIEVAKESLQAEQSARHKRGADRRLACALEIRMKAQYQVRGGILADKIGYGKTATTIGLIDTTASTPLPPIPQGEADRFIAARGTLVIVPSNLHDQWLEEFSKFLTGSSGRVPLKNGFAPSSWPLKVFAMSNVTPLKVVTAGKLAEADVVLCSYRLLYSTVYNTRRRSLAATGGGDGKSFAELTDATKRLLAIRGGAMGARATTDMASVGRWEDLMFPLLEQYYWRRVVFDEFHELEGFASGQQNTLQQLRAHSRWGLTGTPPVASNAGLSFMATLFRIDLPGRLLLGSKVLLPRWETDVLMSEAADRFAAQFMRQNTADSLPHIPLQEHVVVVRHTAAERALYLAQAREAPDPSSPEAFTVEASKKALERLLKLCTHFQAAGGDLGGAASAEGECSRIGVQKKRLVAAARKKVLWAVHALILLEKMGTKSVKHFEGATLCFPDPIMSDAARREATSTAAVAGAKVRDAVTSHVTFVVVGPNSKLEPGRRALPQAEFSRLTRPPPLCDFACRARFTAWRQRADELARGLEAGGADGGGREALGEVLEEAQKACHRERLEFLSGYRLRAGEAFPSGSTDAWVELSRKDIPERHLIALMDSEVDALRGPLGELQQASKSLAFFERTLSALQADATPETRSCTVCLEDNLPLRSMAITPCAHTFCLSCLTDVVTNFKKCSICNTPLAQRDVRPVCEEISPSAGPAEAAPVATELDPRHRAYGTKLAAVVKKLLDIRRSDSSAKVIVFTQFDDLKRRVAAAFDEFNIKTVLLQGNVQHRSKTIHDWQDNSASASFVLLLSLEESASGSNLTAANHVVLLHPMLASTPELGASFEAQAIGRVRRCGQQRAVQVWRFVTAGTVEEKISAAHQSRLWANEAAREEVVPGPG